MGWYAEDEHDSSESDNHGTAKTDVLVKLTCPSGYYSPDGTGCKALTKGTWLKIGSDVGWSAKGNGYGTVQVPAKVCASKVKFVHKSGHVACRAGSAGISNFGCKGSSGIAIHLSTSNKVCKNKCSIAPFKDDKSIKWNNYASNGWWYKTGFSSASKEITVDLPNKRYCFDPLSSYHLWYAEDEHDSSESDNHGTAKTDVLIQLACPSGYLTSKGCQAC